MNVKINLHNYPSKGLYTLFILAHGGVTSPIIKIYIKIKLILLASLLLIGCQANQNDQQEFPKKLVIGFVPSEEARTIAAQLKPIVQHLEKEISIPTELYYASDYTSVIEGMKANKVDLAFFGPFSYVLASSKAAAEPLVVPSKNNIPHSYHSVLITHPDTGIKSLEDLKKSDQYTLTFSDPASTSGHLVPRGFLSQNGMTPEEHFTEVIFSGNHPAAILTLTSKKVDVAGCSLNTLNKMVRENMISENDFIILWKSFPITVDIVAVHATLSDSLKTKLRNEFVQMTEKFPQVGKYFYSEWADSTLEYMPAYDSMYARVREIAHFVTEN